MILNKSNEEILIVQDQSIKDCKDYRSTWEKTALDVELSYK